MSNNSALANVHIEQVAEDAILLSWPQQISVTINRQVIATERHLRQALQLDLVDIIVSYCSLLILLKPASVGNKSLLKKIQQTISLAASDSHSKLPATNKPPIYIDVYYGLDAGWDLKTLSQRSGLSVAQITRLHSDRTYRVFANGFTPGFSYLGIIDQQLQFPRLDTPRVKVPKGAVAIAEQQTAIYPQQTPGGWYIIGQTAADLLTGDNKNQQPLLSVGDEVKFVAIDYQTFINQGGRVAKQGN